MSRVAVSTAALLTVAASIPAAAQGGTSQPTTRPGWKPRRISISGDITPAQRAAAIANLEAIERIFLRVPELARPEDFVISPLFSGVTQDAIRAELAATTPAQRRQPAVVDPTLKTGSMATGYALTDRDVPNAVRVLTPNLDSGGRGSRRSKCEASRYTSVPARALVRRLHQSTTRCGRPSRNWTGQRSTSCSTSRAEC